MMEQSITSILGFAQKAGKLVSGEESTLGKVRRRQVKLVIISQDAAFNTADRLQSKASYYGVPVCTVGNKIELGQAIGKSPRSVIGIIDENFAGKVKDLVEGSW